MTRPLSRPVLVAAIGLPSLLAVGAAVLALVLPGATGDDPAGAGAPDDATADRATAAADGPLALPAVPAPAAATPECAALVRALPAELPSGGARLDRLPLAEPAPPGAAAWGRLGDEPPVVLRCGLDRPAELTRTADLLEVNGVRWLRLADPDPERRAATWVAVDRGVYVALTMPDAAGTGPLQDVSTTIGSQLPSRPVQPAS